MAAHGYLADTLSLESTVPPLSQDQLDAAKRVVLSNGAEDLLPMLGLDDA